MEEKLKKEQRLKELEVDMTPKQIKFCNEFIKLGNGSQAAINAGYSKNSAKEIASENLTKLNIKEYIEIKQKEIQDKTIADAIEIQQYLTAVIRGEVEEEILIGVGPGMQEITNKSPSISDRTRAAELMGRRYALFTDRIDTDVDIGAIIIDDVPSDTE